MKKSIFFSQKITRRNLILLIIFFISMCFVPFAINAQENSDSSVSEIFELKPYAGLVHITTIDYKDALVNRSYFYSVRGGFYNTLNLSSEIKFHLDVGGESNSENPFAFSSFSFEFNKNNFNIKAGSFATLMTCFRPHPLSIGSQFEYYSLGQIMGGAYNTRASYKFNDIFSINAGIAERGDFLGDSTEYSLRLDYKNLQIGSYILDGKFGAIAKYQKPGFMTTAYCRQNLYTQVIEITFKKKFSISADMIYDFQKKQTNYTQKDNLFVEFIFLYLYEYKKTFPGGIGMGIAKDHVNLYYHISL